MLDEISHIHWGVVGSAERLDPNPPTNVSLTSTRGRIDPGTVFFTPEDVVLIVDGATDTRKYMRSIFEPFCKVEEAIDGQQALDMSKERAKPHHRRRHAAKDERF